MTQQDKARQDPYVCVEKRLKRLETKVDNIHTLVLRLDSELRK